MKALVPAALLLLVAPARAGRITVGVDSRIELAGVTQALRPAAEDPKSFRRPDIGYSRMIERLSASGAPVPAAPGALDFEDRCQVLLRVSSAPALAPRLMMPYDLAERAGGPERLQAWLDALSAFARGTDFSAHLARAERLLEDREAALRRKVEERDYVGEEEAYTGLALNGSYSIYLSPYVDGGLSTNSIEPREDGVVEIESVFGRQAGSEEGGGFWSIRAPGLLWHETGHGIVDPLADVFADRVDASSAAYRSSWGCYGDWRQCVKEQVVRAVMIRLVARDFGEAAAADQLAFENEKRFPQLKAMIESLKAYEKSRARYPTLADYYPRLLEVLPPPPEGVAAAARLELAGRFDCRPAPIRNRMRAYLDQLAARAKDPALLAAVRAARAAPALDAAACRESR